MLARVSSFSKHFVIFSIALLIVSCASFCVYVLRHAREAVAEGARAAASSTRAGVSVVRLRTAASHFEPVLNSPEFESAVEFGGDVYVCSSSALFRYSEGGVKQTWHVGRELPPTPLLALAVRTGIGSPELWIATSGSGILVYDGKADGDSFHQLLAEALPLRKVSALLPLRDGHVLVGTPNGLYISDGKSLQVFHREFLKTEVTALAGDEDQFWIGTRADGAWLWRGGEAQHFAADLLPDRQVLSLAASGEDAWVGTPLGISEFKSGKLSRRLAEGVFAQALAEQDGKLWIGTADQGAFMIALAAEKPRPQLSSLSGEMTSGEVKSIASFAHIGDAVAAVEAQAIVHLPDGQRLITAPQSTLTSSHITAVHEDTRGRLWIGYFDRGLDSIAEAGSGALTHLEDDTLFCINRIKENPHDGSVLVGTANGLAVFDAAGKQRQVLNRDNGLISSNVTDVLFQTDAAAESTLAIATPAGLSFLDHGSISSIYAFHGLVNNHVFTLADMNGTLYAGTLGGVSSMRRGLVEASFNTANSALRQNWITASAVFGKHLYLGTYGSGVVRFEREGAVQSFRAFAGGRYEINLNALLATDRALYAGTAGQGLAVLPIDNDRWHFVSAGLPSLNVTALGGRGGRLYVGTDNGLVRISENNLLP